MPASIELLPWIDPLVEDLGFSPRSDYVEICWLPVLGPTATWLYRRLGTWAAASPEGTQVDLTDLAVSLGLGEGLGRNSMIGRGLSRLAHFDVAQAAPGRLFVRRALGPLSETRARTLSESAYRFHRATMERAKP